MRNRYYIFLFAAFLIGCSREVQEPEAGLKTFDCFTVSEEESELTKVHMEDGGAVKWDIGDCIIVYSDVQGPQWYVLHEDGAFHGNPISGSVFYAYSPLDWVSYSDENPTLLNATLTGGISLNPPMVASSTTNELAFKQTCGVLHFILKGSISIAGVDVRGNRNEHFQGSGKISFSDKPPVFIMDDDAEPSVPFIDASGVSIKDGLDIFVYCPPMIFEEGLTLRVHFYDENGNRKSLNKSTQKSITVSRAVMKSFAVVDVDDMISQELEELSRERDALVALYNACAGYGWLNKDNWCSDLPLDQWYGITTDLDGHVSEINLISNNLMGEIPAALSDLTHLRSLDLSDYANYTGDNAITGVDSSLSPMPSLEGLVLRDNPLREFPIALVRGGNLKRCSLLCDFLTIPEEAYQFLSNLVSLEIGDYTATEYVEIPEQVGQLSHLTSLELVGYSGSIPEEIYGLTDLTHLNIGSQTTTGTVSSQIGNLKKLRTLILESVGFDENGGTPRNNLTGELPEALFTECTNLEDVHIVLTHINGEIPPAIANLSKLRRLDLVDNDLSGNLPVEMCQLPFKRSKEGTAEITIMLYGNQLSGKVPAEFKSWEPWPYVWWTIVAGNDLDISDAIPSCPNFEVTLLDGTKYTREQIANNDLTVLFQWASWCPFTPAFLPTLKAAYDKFHDRGLEVLGWSDEPISTVTNYLTLEHIGWKSFSASMYENSILGTEYRMFGVPCFPDNGTPAVTVYNQEGELVFSDRLQDRDDFRTFIENWYGERIDDASEYVSIDFSKDGNVTRLLQSAVPTGLNLVIMADGYSDRQIEAGWYRDVVDKAVNAFFSEAPYKDFKDQFNVYMVEVVSENEGYTGTTALSAYFGTGTEMDGNRAKVFDYAQKALTEEEMNDACILVIVNRDYYAGTCYLYNYELDGDYGRGPAIAFVPALTDVEVFRGLVSHELGGHGFAKLADEYAYENKGTAPADFIADYKETEAYGWRKNVDFTSDPAQVKWSRFITDPRFASEEIGVYEGGATYWTGVWRPTGNSIMRYNVGGFNAPSRYAIWYRINKLANGPAWTGSYEDFVEYDLAHRAPVTKSATKKARNFVERQLPEPTPPVVVNKDWRKR